MERTQRMYATSVSSATVTLSPETNIDPVSHAGVGILNVVVTTFESTAEAAFWGTTGSCGRYQVTFRKIS